MNELTNLQEFLEVVTPVITVVGILCSLVMIIKMIVNDDDNQNTALNLVLSVIPIFVIVLLNVVSVNDVLSLINSIVNKTELVNTTADNSTSQSSSITNDLLLIMIPSSISFIVYLSVNYYHRHYDQYQIKKSSNEENLN